MIGPTTYLKTPTSSLSLSDLRLIAKETINFCVQTMGTRKRKPIPPVSITGCGRSKNYGLYNFKHNRIVINRYHCEDVKLFIRTIIHEYTHYMQDVTKYHSLYKKFGYNRHPYEIEARNSEKLYSPCWKQIKNKI